MDREKIKQFMDGQADFGLLPSDGPLTEDQKRLSALGMAMNAAVVQFINEGLFPIEEQLHFMGHLQDFAARIYRGESLKLPNTNQTLQINSKAGNTFYEASVDALDNGVENFAKMKELSRKMAEAMEQGDPNVREQSAVNPSKPTVH